MDDPNQIPLDTTTFIQFAMGALMSIFAWLGKRHIKRIDDLEAKISNTVSMDQYNGTLAALRSSIDDGNKGTHERIDKLMMFLADQNRNGS